MEAFISFGSMHIDNRFSDEINPTTIRLNMIHFILAKLIMIIFFLECAAVLFKPRKTGVSEPYLNRDATFPRWPGESEDPVYVRFLCGIRRFTISPASI